MLLIEELNVNFSRSYAKCHIISHHNRHCKKIELFSLNWWIQITWKMHKARISFDSQRLTRWSDLWAIQHFAIKSIPFQLLILMSITDYRSKPGRIHSSTAHSQSWDKYRLIIIWCEIRIPSRGNFLPHTRLFSARFDVCGPGEEEIIS